jgi:hypothetical protein
VDAVIESLTEDERRLAKGRLKALSSMGLDFEGRKPMIICDRGCPSKDFIKYQQDNEIKYVMRVQRRFNAVGVLKDRLIGMLITDDSFARDYVFQELVLGIRRRVVPVRPNREVKRKTYLKKSRISITTTNRTVEKKAGGEQFPAVLVS